MDGCDVGWYVAAAGIDGGGNPGHSAENQKHQGNSAS